MITKRDEYRRALRYIHQEGIKYSLHYTDNNTNNNNNNNNNDDTNNNSISTNNSKGDMDNFMCLDFFYILKEFSTRLSAVDAEQIYEYTERRKNQILVCIYICV